MTFYRSRILERLACPKCIEPIMQILVATTYSSTPLKSDASLDLGNETADAGRELMHDVATGGIMYDLTTNSPRSVYSRLAAVLALPCSALPAPLLASCPPTSRHLCQPCV